MRALLLSSLLLLVLSSLLLLAASAVAQSPASASDKGAAITDSSRPTLQRPGETSFALLAPVRRVMGVPVRTCAYIHSFVFERHNGEAPRLVKETYCTPTDQFQVHRAANFGLYPAVVTGSPKSLTGPQ